MTVADLAALLPQLPDAGPGAPVPAGIADPARATDPAVRPAAVEVRGVTLDSRAVAPGDLYAALPGARAHGAGFAADAVRAGAVAVLTDPAGARLLDGVGEVPVLVVPDPRAVLGDVAARVHGTGTCAEDGPLLLGVTGTNGKTTTAYLLEGALSATGRTTALVGTVETRVAGEVRASVRTTPEAPDVHALLALMASRHVDVAAMEVSSHALALHRVDGVVFDVAAFTNLSQDHLDFHGDLEEYFAAKASLFTPRRARRGVVCVDDAWGRRLAAGCAVPVTTVATGGTGAPGGPDPDWTTETLHADATGTDFVLRPAGGGPALHLRAPLPGAFNVANAAVAAVVLLQVGLGPADVARGLAAATGVPGRMEVVGIQQVQQPAEAAAHRLPRVVVDYAHTPDAVAAALQALRTSTAGLLVVVLGAGGDRDRGKRAAMGERAAQHADVVVVTDDNPRSEDPAAVRAAVLAGARHAAADGTLVVEVAGRGAAIAAAVARAGAPDGPQGTVLVAGKGHERGQEVAGTVHPFDDRDEARAALAALARAHGEPPRRPDAAPSLPRTTTPTEDA